MADKLSAELLAAHPESLTYQGTRGGILAEIGMAEAASILEQVVARSSAKHDQSISAAMLALFYHRGGQSEFALHWLEKARAANESCPAVLRIQRELSIAAKDQADTLSKKAVGNG